MRFRGTFLLLLVGLALGAYVYFYEIKGGEKREKAKQEENRIWKVDTASIQQIELSYPDQRITVERRGEKEWKITAPRTLDADAEEINRLASSAADISRESVLESNAADLSRFGLEPPQIGLELRTKDGKQYRVGFGNNNPTGNSTYAAIAGKKEVMLVPSYVASGFRKKLEDLRNRTVLGFEQVEAQSLEIRSGKGDLRLTKENDRWWVEGKERWAADASAVSTILSSLASGRVKEFLDDPGQYADLGFDRPTVDVRVAVGKDRAIRHLTIGKEKAKLVSKGGKKPAPDATAAGEASAAGEVYVARDEARTELFFVEKELVDKLLKSPADLRDKALASFQRWDVDSIFLTNTKGTFQFTKSGAGGDWVLGDSKKKAKWDAVTGILDALEKPVKSFVDAPGAPATYGLDAPSVRVILKQGPDVKLDCSFGKETAEGVYAQVKGESSVKVAEKETLEKLNKAEADFIEPPAAEPAKEPAKK